MRLISFSLTTPQFKARTKTVTRRKGWLMLQPGDRLMAVEKGMGLKPGEKVVRLGEIEVVSMRRELLSGMYEYPQECAREGFADWTVAQFVDLYCKANGGDQHQIVTRIEYRYVEPKP